MRVLRLALVLAACGHPAPRRPATTRDDELTVYRDVTVVRHDGLTSKTTAVRWDASYTLMASATRDHATLSGTLTIRNAGVALRGTVHIFDVDLANVSKDTPSRDLGTLTIPAGESRVPLVSGAQHRLHPVLVYDPIGTKLDNPSATPLRDASLGVSDPVSPSLSDAFEIDRDSDASGLPGGPVRLIEQRSGRVLGEGRLFDESTRRDLDTIAIGTVQDVAGKRERRELTDEESRHRLVEEFVIEIDNARLRPIEVLVREHLYRGQTWAVAYQSVPDVHRDGAQAFVMRTFVAPRGQVKIMYVVVYTWGT